MRGAYVVLAVVAALVIALIAEALLDSAIAAWVALALVAGVGIARLLAGVPGVPGEGD